MNVYTKILDALYARWTTVNALIITMETIGNFYASRYTKKVKNI